MRIKALYFIVIFTIFFTNFIVNSYAVGIIPRDGLRLELYLATGAQDTSGNNRPITSTGLVPTYQVDPIYGIPYAQFTGSGGLKVNTAWNAGGTDDFSVSMWTRIDKSSFLYASGELLVAKSVNVNGANNYHGYHSYVTQPLFINGSGFTTNNSLRLLINPEGKCAFRGSSIPYETYIQNYYQNTELGYMASRYDYYRFGYGNNMTEKFDCLKLIDSKWHHIILIKKAGVLSFNIDGIEVVKINGAFELGRELLLGYSNHFSNSAYSGTIFSSGQIKMIEQSHYSKVSMASLRIYDRPLNLAEIEALGDEYRYAQSELAGAGNIILAMDKYITPNLTIQIKSIPLNLSKDLVQYQYSTDGITFTRITSLTDISNGTGSLSYLANINLSGVPDGKVNITLRVESIDGSFQNIGVISFTKLDNSMNITINQPSTEIASSKAISATTDTGSMLYMSQTRSSICDGTITVWEDYSDLIFAGRGDNGIRVCYKAVSISSGKVIYKLSQAIQGIQPTNDQNNASQSIFADYLLWVRSPYQKLKDSTYTVLDLFAVDTRQPGINGVISTDINGDGLVDFLYSSRYTVSVYYNPDWVTDTHISRAILVNNGNYTFTTVYRCVQQTIHNITTYYGDCADPTR